MPKDYDPIDPTDVVTYPLGARNSKFTRDDLARPHRPGAPVGELLASLPRVLGADDLRNLAGDVVRTVTAGRPVVVGMGAHVIKTGCAPVLIDLMERGIVHVLAMNGAGIVHDIEMAMVGHTSEDVDASLPGGGFGMARETAEELNAAMQQAPAVGLGRAVGNHMLARGFPYVQESLLASAARLEQTATVHVALGTDIIHMHPDTDGAAIGEATLRDFRTFASAVADLSGGVYLNLGSAVILPEIFLKALSLARNLGARLDDLVTANLDFIRHYRTTTNVVRRPAATGGGRGYNLVGHHEIMIPLLAAAILEGLDGQDSRL